MRKKTIRKEVREEAARRYDNGECAGEIAKALGIGESTVYKIARVYGAKKHRSRVMTEEGIQMLKERFADTRNAILAKWLGLSVPCVTKHARRLGLKKDPDFISRNSKRVQRDIRENQPERYRRICEIRSELGKRYGNKFVKGQKNPYAEKARRTLAEMRATERRRAFLGLAPLTKLRTGERRTPYFRALYATRNVLKRKYGYLTNEGKDLTIMYYNDSTVRSDKREKYYFEKFKMKFRHEREAEQ